MEHGRVSIYGQGQASGATWIRIDRLWLDIEELRNRTGAPVDVAPLPLRNHFALQARDRALARIRTNNNRRDEMVLEDLQAPPADIEPPDLLDLDPIVEPNPDMYDNEAQEEPEPVEPPLVGPPLADVREEPGMSEARTRRKQRQAELITNGAVIDFSMVLRGSAADLIAENGLMQFNVRDLLRRSLENFERRLVPGPALDSTERRVLEVSKKKFGAWSCNGL